MNIKYIVVHCSATKPSMDIGKTEIDIWHKSRGWSGIGYHYVIRRNGKIEIGRPNNRVGAHVYGYNKVSIGICLVGGVAADGKSEDNFTSEQFDSLEELLKVQRKIYANAKILGHRDLSPDINGDGIVEKREWKKDCPCFEVSEFVKERLCKKKKWSLFG